MNLQNLSFQNPINAPNRPKNRVKMMNYYRKIKIGYMSKKFNLPLFLIGCLLSTLTLKTCSVRRREHSLFSVKFSVLFFFWITYCACQLIDDIALFDINSTSAVEWDEKTRAVHNPEKEQHWKKRVFSAAGLEIINSADFVRRVWNYWVSFPLLSVLFI